ncbi:TadE/TadG family type IV pilus assembly protein [Helicobacter cappadocius]|uniref:TadE/TadG family type IV pilus assembly protein n=1 Tax=Helicobacter cappadocius TaxID=3063998 RepID=A0AA90PJP9_9HELI|nr:MULTISPECIES: TadE/TadG family type IV pilus assembly protein [unclassified Helicobacter]MDO7253119.1 TadE/TadG family type IV pilus assembly protein [Helicobacter sp. faydin-H75]MDP2538755.1 TadE/TadG family type IV pilus assembly protein [Helicobacter sp. faydin-H76]
MKKYCDLQDFIRSKKGLATLEFAILFLPFFLLIMSIVETMILIYQISIIDYITTSSAQYTAASSPYEGYEKTFQEYINKYKNNLLLFTDVKNSLKPSLKFCRSIAELEKNNCTGNNIENKLIIYTLTYKINPIFKILRIFEIPEETVSKAIYYSEKNDYQLDNDENKNNQKNENENNKS